LNTLIQVGIVYPTRIGIALLLKEETATRYSVRAPNIKENIANCEGFNIAENKQKKTIRLW